MAATVAISKFMWGDLVANLIDFLIIAFIVFLAYKQLSRFKLVEDKAKHHLHIRSSYEYYDLF